MFLCLIFCGDKEKGAVGMIYHLAFLHIAAMCPLHNKEDKACAKAEDGVLLLVCVRFPSECFIHSFILTSLSHYCSMYTHTHNPHRRQPKQAHNKVHTHKQHKQPGTFLVAYLPVCAPRPMQLKLKDQAKRGKPRHRHTANQSPTFPLLPYSHTHPSTHTQYSAS
jgi:hypothetical protein